MKAFFSNWSWKGFFSRYFLILAILLLVNYFYQDTDVSRSKQVPPSTQQETTMVTTHKVVGNDLHLEFELTNFTLSLENVNKEKGKGEGHIHLYIDGKKMTKIYDKTYVWKALTKGEHEIRVELAHNDHDPYGVEETFEIDIK
jgi:hypothetical protein